MTPPDRCMPIPRSILHLISGRFSDLFLLCTPSHNQTQWHLAQRLGWKSQQRVLYRTLTCFPLRAIALHQKSRTKKQKLLKPENIIYGKKYHINVDCFTIRRQKHTISMLKTAPFYPTRHVKSHAVADLKCAGVNPNLYSCV